MPLFTAIMADKRCLASWQVHGHDFSCVCTLPDSAFGRRLYASGSEEKVIRVLEAPTTFMETLDFFHGKRRDIPVSASTQVSQVQHAVSDVCLLIL